MKTTTAWVILLTSIEALAGDGPTTLGALSVGMSKAEYIAAIGIAPIDCNTFRDTAGKPNRSELKNLSATEKTLCWSFSFGKTGSMENIQVSDVSYDVITASYESSATIRTFGNSSKAIFLKDKLISLEIYAPNVSIETLVTKYGAPKLVDNRKVEVCKNRIGNEFNNNIGKLDAVWINGSVNSILRVVNSSPQSTCTDGSSMRYYILEEPRQIAMIEATILKYREGISKDAAKDSKF